MNSTTRTLLTLSVLVMLCASMMFAGGTVVTIVHVNDTHSHLDAFGPKDFHLNGTLGGIAKAANIVGAIRAKEDHVLLLHGGDAFVGDFFFNAYFGVPELQLMGQLGFDAMAVGNHEFDLYPATLLSVLENAAPAFPLLSANLDMSAYDSAGPLQKFIKPSIILNRGVKIGIFGLTVWDNPSTNAVPIVIVQPDNAGCQKIVNDLRSQGAAVVICLSHMGYLHDQEIASGVSGIDVIVGAHDHYLFDKPVRVNNGSGRETLILQAGAFYMHVGELRLNVEGKNVTFVDYRMIPVDKHVSPVPEIQGVVNQLKTGIVQTYGDVYHKPVAFSLCDLEREYDPSSQIRDTPMGNLVTDALRNKGGTQLGFSAIGLINEKIYAGTIVGADVFRAFPYGYDQQTGLGLKLITVRTDGMSLITGIESALSFLGINEDYFPQISGMTFRFDGTKPVGGRVILRSVRVGGRPFDPSAKYTMTIDEGLAGLLPLLGVQADTLRLMPDNEYTVVKDYIRRLGVVAYRPEGRIRDVSVKCPGEHFSNEDAAASSGSEAAPALVKSFELGQNFPNPFNPGTTIRYGLPSKSLTTLRVFNTLGQMVKELVNETQEAGIHEVRFDASGFASGVYFYRLQAGSLAETRRLTLLK